MTDRYRFIMDDAFINFRYADNLLFLDRGLTYNPNEYVEGFSSPLWMLVLLACRAFELDYYVIVRTLALVFAAAYGGALVWINRELSARSEPTVNFPLAASAAHYGLTTHFSSGLETPMVQLLAPLFTAALLRPRNVFLQITMATAPLVRAECGLLWVAYGLWAFWRERKLPWVFLSSALLLNVAWISFRVIYYADFLPNTFYLKDVSQWRWGWDYVLNVADTHHWPYVIVLLAALAWHGRKKAGQSKQRLRSVLLTTAIVYGLYVVRIGGDMLYHRYAAMPVCLMLCASAGIMENGLLPSIPYGVRAGVAASLALVICVVFGLAYPPQLDSHPIWGVENVSNWRVISDASWHRHFHSLAYSDARRRENEKQLARYKRMRQRGEPHDPPIKLDGLCRQGFAHVDSVIIHPYGLTNPALARLPRSFGRPGHKQVAIEAQDIKRLLLQARNVPGTPWYDVPYRPEWVKKNQAALDILERKVHNDHELSTNFALAMTLVRMR